MAAVAPMSYLQLVNKLIQKCGISGNTLATLQGQTGEMARCIAWIDEAYLNIQEIEPNWDWMTGTVSFPTVAQQQFYTPTQTGLTDWAAWDPRSWRVYFNTPGIRTEVFLQWMDWEDYRDWYLYGNMRLTYGMPISIAQQPGDHALGLGLIPDAVGYTIDGQYFRAPSSLALDADVPLMPARFQMLIVYLAMQYYGDYEFAPEVTQAGKTQFKQMLRRMMDDQLPPIEVGAPLR